MSFPFKYFINSIIKPPKMIAFMLPRYTLYAKISFLYIAATKLKYYGAALDLIINGNFFLA